LLLTQIYQKSVDFVYPPQDFQFVFLAVHNLGGKFFQPAVDYPDLDMDLLPFPGRLLPGGHLQFVARGYDEFDKTPHRLFVAVHGFERGGLFQFFPLEVDCLQSLRNPRLLVQPRGLRAADLRVFFRFRRVRPKKIGKLPPRLRRLF
jgi:hypothetical protein